MVAPDTQNARIADDDWVADGASAYVQRAGAVAD